MTIKTEPFLSGKWGWDEGESGWKEGVDENFLKFAYLLNSNVDGFVGTLPASPTNGTAYFLTTDNSLNARVDGVWSKYVVPKGFVVTDKATGAKYEFSGSAFVPTLTATDKTKLDGVATGATVNATNAELRDRATHTGAQATSTITGLDAALAAKAPLASPTFTGTPVAPTPSTADNSTTLATTAYVKAQGYLTSSSGGIVTSVATRTGDVTLTKTDVGLSAVNNTSDASKPISTATQTALNLKAPLESPVFTTAATLPAATTIGTVTAAEVLTLSGVTSAIQTQINGKAATSHTHSAATTSVDGFLSAADKTKLNGVATGATANSSNATLLARGNHTGTQLSSTISDFTEAVQDVVGATVVGAGVISATYDDVVGTHTISTTATVNSPDATLLARDNHTGTQATSTITGFTEAVQDLISTTVVGTGNITATYDDVAGTHTVSTTATVNSSDATLLARANHTGTQAVGTITGLGSLATLSTAPIANGGTGATTAATARTNLGLGNVDNTSDANKPVSTATQTALGSKADVSHTHSAATTIADGFMSLADKTKLDGVATGATANSSNATLLARANHTGTQAQSTVTNLVTDLAAKAPLASPTFTGTAVLPSTTSIGTVSSTEIGYLDGVTSSVQSQLDGKQPLNALLTNTTESFTTALKAKLDGVADGAEVNVNTDWNAVSGDAQLLNKPTTLAGYGITDAAPLSHVGGSGTQHASATTSVAGFMSGADKTKLNGIATAATANSSDATLLARANHTGSQAISTVTGLQTALDGKVALTSVGAASGVASLDGSGKVPSSQLPTGGSYKGTWDASTNTPTIVSSVGTNGDFYKVATAGSTTINGVTGWVVGDEIIFSGTVWQKVPNSALVSSVAGKTGAVTLVAADVGITIGTNVQAYDADLGAIAALAGTSGFLKKTATNTWALDTATYLTGNQTITFSGDLVGTGTTAIDVDLSTTGVAAGTYKSVTVDTKGRVTSATNPTTLSGYGITDAVALTGTQTVAGAKTFSSSITALTLVSNVVSTNYDVTGLADTGTAISKGVAVHDSNSWTNKAVAASTTVTFNQSGSRQFQLQVGSTGSSYIRALHTTGDNVWRQLWDSSNTLAIGSTALTARTALGLATVASSGSAADLSTGTLPSARLSGTYNITNSGSSATLATPRTVITTGDVTYTSGGFDGSSNVTGVATLANSGVVAGTYNDSVTAITPYVVDSKGRVTGVGAAVTITPAFSSITSKPTTLSGYGITDAQSSDADLTAIAALAGTSGFLKKTATNTWALDTATYLTGNQTITFSGDLVGTGTTAIDVDLATTGVTAGTYKSVTVDDKGRVISATNPTTLAGFGITDAVALTGTQTVAGSKTFSSSITAPTLVSNVASTNYDVTGLAGTGDSIPAGIALHDSNSWTNKASAGSTTVTFSKPPSRQFQLQVSSTGRSFIRALHASIDNTWRELWDSSNTLNIGNTSLTARTALGLATVASSGSAADLSTGTLPSARLSGTYNITNSGSSATLATPRTVILTGDVTYTSGGFDGSANVTGVATLANSGVVAGTYKSVTVDAKGRVTGGTNPTTLSGFGITDAVDNTSAQSIGGIKTFSAKPVFSDGVNAGGSGTTSNFYNISCYSISGIGSSLIGLNASNLGLGTVPTVRLPASSTSAAGIVQLDDSTSSASSLTAATSNAVRSAYIIAANADINANSRVAKETPTQLFQSIGSGSGARTIDGGQGLHVLATATGNTTWTFPAPSATEALALTLELTNGGAYTMTWPTGMRWSGGVAPTLTASGTDVLVFTKAGTNNWRGYLSSKDSK